MSLGDLNEVGNGGILGRSVHEHIINSAFEKQETKGGLIGAWMLEHFLVLSANASYG